MAGYSGTPLAKKLGIAGTGQRVLLANAPTGFVGQLTGLPDGVEIEMAINKGQSYDVIVWFVTNRKTLVTGLAALRASMSISGGLWVAWPKKSSRVATDVTEDVIRELALSRKLVDNKVCAIDDTWSGLRLVIPVALRPKKANGK